MRLLLTVFVAVLSTLAARAEVPTGRLPPDPAIEAKIDALIARMTLEDKAGQMYMGAWSPTFDDREVREGSIGALSAPPDAATANRIQAVARASRLGIPLLFTQDVIHGYRTLFPVPLGLAASFDARVVAAAGEATAREARSIGLRFALSPMLDLSRDPRWGRVIEGPGEDPFIGRLYAAAMVHGLARGGLAATLKHFVGYGAVKAGRDYAEAEIPTTVLHDLYLPAFRAGIDAGAQVVMAAFNAVNGVPVTANRRLLTGTLKESWGFDGFVTSDWDSVHELISHGLAATREEAVEKAVMAGLDMEMSGRLYPDFLPGLVRAGRVPEARLDDAVRRVLRVKFRLGLFDPPGPFPAADPAAAATVLAAPEIRAAARDAARRSIVLLKNDGELLPLVRPPRRIAVIGAAARDPSDHMGSWGAAAHRDETPVVFDELRDRLAGKGTTVTFAEGCDDACRTTDGFDAAVATAADADLIVAVLGEPWYMTAESTSRTRIGLPGHQSELLARLAATGRPVVLVVFAGRPMTIADDLPRAGAILWAFSPGTMGGPALADLILGDAAPSARLPMSLPRTVGQIPIAYDQLPTGRPADPKAELNARWLDSEVTPLFPFGFGLTYGGFSYADLRLDADRVPLGGTLRASVAVTSTGTRPTREVVQLYVRDLVASRSRPLKELKGVAVVDLAPGETRRVEIAVPVADLGFHDDDGRYAVEPGRFRLFVGGSSEATLAGEFEVVER